MSKSPPTAPTTAKADIDPASQSLLEAISELEVLFPAGKTLHIGDDTLVIKPLTAGQYPSFFRCIQPMTGLFESASIDWMTLLCEYGSDVLMAISIAIEKPRGWINSLMPDQVLLIAAAIIEVNADFFSKRLIPMFNALMQQVSDLKPGVEPSKP